MDYDNLQGVKNALGVNDVRNAGRSRNYPYSYPFRFTSLASGSNVAVTQKITASAAFVVSVTNGSVFDTATGSRPEYVTAAPYGFLEDLLVSFRANEGEFQQNNIPWSCILGTAERPFYWPFRMVFAPGSNVVVTVTNTTGKTISGAVVFTGHHLGTT